MSCLDDWANISDVIHEQFLTQDSVEFRRHKCHSGFAHRLRKRLINDVDSTDVNGVRRQKSGQTSGPVPDVERGAVLDVGLRLGRVVLVVQQTGDVCQVTLFAERNNFNISTQRSILCHLAKESLIFMELIR